MHNVLCVMCNEFMLHIVMTTSVICILCWTLHRSKCADYHYVVMWSCSNCNAIQTHTPNLQYVPILCLRAYITFSCQITQSYFQPTLFAAMRCCCSCGPVRRSLSLESVQCVLCHTCGHCLCTEHKTWNQSVACIHSGSAHRCKNAY